MYRLEDLEPKAFIPFTNIPWGFGNLLDDKIFSKILENRLINKHIKKFFKNKKLTINEFTITIQLLPESTIASI